MTKIRRSPFNAYYCDSCGGYIVTEDIDEGVTPMFLACRVLGDPSDPANTCKGQSRSMMYPKRPWPEKDGNGTPIPTEPAWEWFRPENLNGLTSGMCDHVKRGGLILRQRSIPTVPLSFGERAL